MTRTLVTNDDGIDAPGLHALAAAALSAGLDVVIAAPASQSSGASASIMAEDHDGRIAVERRDIGGLEEIPAFAVHGGPGLIAMIATHGAFGPPPELVLSGVNHGANVGRAILHSGTVGAALTAGLNGARALAVSLDVGMRPTEFHWEAAAQAVLRLLPDLLARSPGTVLNVNAPNTAEPRGVREASLAPFGIVQTTLSEREEHHIRLAVEDLPNVPEPGTDAAHLAEGWITVTGLDSITAVPLGWD
ncbi:5'/3'-nucleotidase SurE [Microbacterium sp. zg.Y1090]|uniref:5'/3'-nucleotidase SurE n=1 Tax=Microbacterium TaxID=33882 RepID=UPI00214AC1C3|nr:MULTISPECIES: 5'/3'-nucleotidase SurE [unclassified Microbacterium]MCR2812382.1 5'/3'-nucleotidase SurE [Microbacterium sp. zg.Y1084]MCR2817817.1 5'/3'-nucleotidase SurE [Microbacterium sp. zg.Y1090]MDL5485539.1 5'/3'-nucleotidase SurE [Microbacterium sp. zg-Y1211]WIM28710.1 5'/3'-nucleotidase SurE [Microbacterium sp. zg-Y1090]